MHLPSTRFHFVTTEDGSPSLRLRLGEENESESMHSLRGAFSETLYIYGDALEHAIRECYRPHVLSLGLGLGYNEILTTAMFERAGAGRDQLVIESFEADQDLIAYFRAWVEGREVPSEFKAAYDQILNLVAMKTEIKSSDLLARLRELLMSERLLLREALTPQNEFTRRFSVFLFDAFSSKTTPELWSEEFLTKFIGDTSDERAVFSTYACTGALKRSLKTCGFALNIRHGFSSKRDSTFAVRAPAQTIVHEQ